MTDLMQALQTDHHHFSQLLDVLMEGLATLQQDGRPDYAALLDSVDYLQDYADRYHYPKEDLIYERYLERNDEARSVIEDLPRQHRDLKQRTARLRKILEGLLHDAVISKKQLMDQLNDFIERQTVHLRTEEAKIFPLLAQRLTAADWSQLAARLPSRIDPLFGDRVARQYRALYERIVATT